MDDKAKAKLDRAQKAAEQEELQFEIWQQMYEDQLEAQALEDHFDHLTKSQIIELYRTQTNEKGERLSEWEWHALCEQWHFRFNEVPPNWTQELLPDGAELPKASKPDPLDIEYDYHDDAMLRPKDVQLVTGWKRSTMRRRREQGVIGPPHQLGSRAIGWPWREVRDVLKEMKKARNGRK